MWLSGSAGDVALSTDGNYAFAGTTNGAVVIVDLSTPTVPVVVGEADFPVAITGVTLSKDNELLYAMGGASGIFVLDVSLVTAPKVIGGVDTPGEAIAAFAGGD